MNIIIPGLRNSDENHWQSIWEQEHPQQFYRVVQDDWEHPDCVTWVDRIEEALKEFKYENLILIGHSVGCVTILKWVEKYKHTIAGALLVAPSDVEKPNYPAYITGYKPMPVHTLPFPSIVVASTNDHVVSLERAEYFASNWGSELVVLPDAGHIEPKSGFGKWDLGLDLIQKLRAKTATKKIEIL